jgi:hypothetical protein
VPELPASREAKADAFWFGRRTYEILAGSWGGALVRWLLENDLVVRLA